MDSKIDKNADNKSDLREDTNLTDLTTPIDSRDERKKTFDVGSTLGHTLSLPSIKRVRSFSDGPILRHAKGKKTEFVNNVNQFFDKFPPMNIKRSRSSNQVNIPDLQINDVEDDAL